MTPVFADTSYFLGFLGENDQHHGRAVAWTRTLRAPVVTTEYVMIEVGNSLTKGGDRAVFVDFYRALRQGTKLEVIAASTEL
jgi:predicted nucleic acid-binding protein